MEKFRWRTLCGFVKQKNKKKLKVNDKIIIYLDGWSIKEGLLSNFISIKIYLGHLTLGKHRLKLAKINYLSNQKEDILTHEFNVKKGENVISILVIPKKEWISYWNDYKVNGINVENTF